MGLRSGSFLGGRGSGAVQPGLLLPDPANDLSTPTPVKITMDTSMPIQSACVFIFPPYNLMKHWFKSVSLFKKCFTGIKRFKKSILPVKWAMYLSPQSDGQAMLPRKHGSAVTPNYHGI
jgi:hypothetical protein